VGKGTSIKSEEKELLDALKEVEALSQSQIDKAIEEAQRTDKSLKDLIVEQLKMAEVIKKQVERDDGTVEIGELMKKAGWITSEQLEKLRSGEAEDENLEQVLLDEGVVTKDQMKTARQVQRETGIPLWRTLVNLGTVTTKHIRDAMTREISLPFFKNMDQKTCDLILAKGLMDKGKLESAMEKSKAEEKSLYRYLLEKGMLSETELLGVLAEQFNMPIVDLDKLMIGDDAVRMLPDSLIIEHSAIPVDMDDKHIRIAFWDPKGVGAIENTGIMMGLEIKPVLATKSQIQKAIDYYVIAGRKEERPTTSIVKEGEEYPMTIEVEKDGKKLREMVGTTTIINLVNSIIEGAVNSRATDIHLDPQVNGLRVRYRIDGMLHDVMNIPVSQGPAVVSRVKIMSDLDIINRMHPQDGHIKMKIKDNMQDMRVATIPTTLGEKVTIRLMSETNVLTGLGQLGLEPQQLKILDKLVAKPYGLLLATGPVGSGKTTTLYSCLNKVNILTKNVMTIEDPVEYKLMGTNQIQVNLRTNFDFAEGLRAMLRQDPNTIMVGEIRDGETAKIGVRAALTGVLVFSTMHANEASGVVSNLYNYGIPGFLVSNALIGVVSQRLVRKICENCKESYKPDKDLIKQMALPSREVEGLEFSRGRGCAKCFRTGYLGRTGVYELMEVDEVIKDLIFRMTTKEVIRQVAIDMGMQTLKYSTFNKVKEGITTVEEYFRIVFI